METLNLWLDKVILGVSIYDFLISFVMLSFCIALRSPFSKIILGALKKVVSKTETTVDDKILAALEAPFKFSFIILGFYLAQIFINAEKYEIVLKNIIFSLLIFLVFWILYRLINEFNAFISIFSSKIWKPLNTDIENFIIKTCKVFIIVIGFLMFLESWGVNITALIASLGLGGLAFALAAKDTTANLFGSLVIFADRPFSLGDCVEIGGVEGTVEEIGIRSTRIRTFQRAQVSIPNAVVANASISNWTRRTSRRSKAYIGLTYSTTVNQVEAIIKDIRDLLTAREDIYDDSLAVYFESFGDSSLNILCHYHTKTTVWKEFLQTQEEINLAIMNIVEKNGSSFAFPSRSIYIENQDNKEETKL